MVKNLPVSAGDAGSIPGLGRSPGGGNGNPLQYFCPGNPMDRGAWWATVPGVTKESDRTQRPNNKAHSLPIFERLCCFLGQGTRGLFRHHFHSAPSAPGLVLSIFIWSVVRIREGVCRYLEKAVHEEKKLRFPSETNEMHSCVLTLHLRGASGTLRREHLCHSSPVLSTLSLASPNCLPLG